jgi:hypothetical protein
MRPSVPIEHIRFKDGTKSSEKFMIGDETFGSVPAK